MKILDSFHKLEGYIISEGYKGYDPYDVLMSPLFGLPILRSSKFMRLGAQQILRRLRFNVRPLLGIKKSLNPVTAGLMIYAFSLLRSFSPERKEFYDKEIINLVTLLKECSSKGYSGICWGYNFDWEARYAKIPAYYPTVVATGIVVNGLFNLNCQLFRLGGRSPRRIFDKERAIKNEQLKGQKEKSEELFSRDSFLEHKGMTTSEKKFNNGESHEKESAKERGGSSTKNVELKEKIEEMIVGAADFVRKDLNKIDYGDTFCYSYSPDDKQSVLNASMKGVRILAQAYSINKDYSLIEEAERAVKFVVDSQKSDGSWIYSVGDNREWSDSYHTGYILDCLKSFIDLSGLTVYSDSLDKGFEFFKSNFIGKDGFPKYYNNEKYPVDCTSAGQIVLTLCNFGELDLAESVLNYMIKNMQDKKGYFYYQKNKYCTNRISYMRWSNAWMFVAMARFLSDKVAK